MKFKVSSCSPKQENPYKGAFCAIQAVSCRSNGWRKRVKELAEDLLPGLDVSGLYKRIPRTAARDKDKKRERELIYVSVAGDFHIPNHDKKAVLLWLQFIKDIQPDYIVILGDVVDFPAISRFEKTLDDELSMVNACIDTRKLFALIRSLCPDSIIKYIEGNHEFRWDAFWGQDKNRAMGRVASAYMTLGDIFGLKEFGIEHFAYHKYWTFKNFVFKHDEKYFGGAFAGGMSARNTFREWGCSGIIGHTHRGGVFYCTNKVSGFAVAENFCLCSLKPDWKTDPDWMQGHSLIKFNRTSDRFHITQMPIVGNAFVYGDRIYR